jgi:type IV pilus assembly protein PilM
MITGNIYTDKPLFGLDIGSSTIKVMQILKQNNKYQISGYGVIEFDPEAVKHGGIEDIESVAKSVKNLFDHELIGKINTRRVAMSLPSSRTYSRVLSLPKLTKKELSEAIKLEAEQYIPVPLDDLYIDYQQISFNQEDNEYFLVGIPKTIVDSYMQLAEVLGLEVAALETSMNASSRLVSLAEEITTPTLLIDFGSLSADLTIYDKHPIVTGTVIGGNTFTEIIAKKLKVTDKVATTIKIKYGLGVSKKQAQITDALQPALDSLTKEINKMQRYYEDKTKGKKTIAQIVSLGGGANMPGLSDYITASMRIPTRMCHPWTHISFGKLQPTTEGEKTMFITVAGLALIEPKEIWE